VWGASSNKAHESCVSENIFAMIASNVRAHLELLSSSLRTPKWRIVNRHFSFMHGSASEAKEHDCVHFSFA
jgi:hypothetical protein